MTDRGKPIGKRQAPYAPAQSTLNSTVTLILLRHLVGYPYQEINARILIQSYLCVELANFLPSTALLPLPLLLQLLPPVWEQHLMQLYDGV